MAQPNSLGARVLRILQSQQIISCHLFDEVFLRLRFQRNLPFQLKQMMKRKLCFHCILRPAREVMHRFLNLWEDKDHVGFVQDNQNLVSHLEKKIE